MKKWILIMLIIAALAFGSVIGFNFFIKAKIDNAIANMPEPVYPVTALTLQPSEWQPTVDAIGFVEPNQGITVSNEVSGIINKIGFQNGSHVNKGQLLIGLDSKVERANLQAKLVQLPAVKGDYQRLLKLYKQKSVSQQDLDNAEAKYLALNADIESLKATINRREIRAPFAGLVGIRNVNLGDYIQMGTNLVQLEDLTSMKIRFTVPQTQLSKIAVGQQVQVMVDAYPAKPFIGQISAIEPAVFQQSGLIQVQAKIPNDDLHLRSGMFAKVAIILPKLEQQFVLPQTAINFTLYGNSIYLIQDHSKDGKTTERVKQIDIHVLERNGNNALVSGDIKAGEKIVTSGQISLSNNSKVHIVENDALAVPATMPQL
ncbi:efflux RND transporter periplasmic adaptor subunit [Shewanella marina]|uniref:efflux RND transporter periplasmic adaptor subunit n=1 Tax=Shewanella marina TaxID=487319 RepID=UPI00046E7D62|nr:efflux RND transporter periplasmic adaptor subunit [Shewanella marina]